MKVGYIGTGITQHLQQMIPGGAGPSGTGSQSSPTHFRDARIVLSVFDDLMAVLA